MILLSYRLSISGASPRDFRYAVKKSSGHFFSTPRERYQFMKQYNQGFSIKKISETLGVSCSGYYRFLKAKPSAREQENQVLLKEIYKIHQDSYGTYGSPLIHAELKDNGEI